MVRLFSILVSSSLFGCGTTPQTTDLAGSPDMAQPTQPSGPYTQAERQAACQKALADAGTNGKLCVSTVLSVDGKLNRHDLVPWQGTEGFHLLIGTSLDGCNQDVQIEQGKPGGFPYLLTLIFPEFWVKYRGETFCWASNKLFWSATVNLGDGRSLGTAHSLTVGQQAMGELYLDYNLGSN